MLSLHCWMTVLPPKLNFFIVSDVRVTNSFILCSLSGCYQPMGPTPSKGLSTVTKLQQYVKHLVWQLKGFVNLCNHNSTFSF